MSDIQINQRDLVPIVGELKKQQLVIEINEKLASVKGLKLRLENLVNIEQKKLEFQINVLEKQIAFQQEQFTDEDKVVEVGVNKKRRKI